MLVKSPDTAVLIDCGINGKCLRESLARVDMVPEDLSGILITHDHRDHTSGLGVVMRRHRLPVYITEKTYAATRPSLGKIDETLVRPFVRGESFVVGDFLVDTFATEHDAADSLGFHVKHSDGSVAVCTDLGCMTETVREGIKGANLIYIEANYDPELLQNGKYPYYLKERIRGGRGHLSNNECGETMTELLEAGTEHFVLSHLSQENNHPDLAELTVLMTMNAYGAKRDLDYRMSVAKRYAVSEITEI